MFGMFAYILVSSLCEKMGKRDGICEQKAKTKDTQ